MSDRREIDGNAEARGVRVLDVLVLVSAAKRHCADCSMGFCESGWSDEEVEREHCRTCAFKGAVSRVEQIFGEVDMLEEVKPTTTAKELLTPYARKRRGVAF